MTIMMVRCALLLLLPAVFLANGESDLYVYDQRQNGTYNVQFHLKDVQILAILDGSVLSDYGNYDDYSYDYQDPIETQPLPQPSQEPEIQTSTSAQETSTNPSISIKNTTTISSLQSENVTCKDENQTTVSPIPVSMPSSSTVAAPVSAPVPAPISVALPAPVLDSKGGGRKRQRCAQGFVRDHTGRCRNNGRPLIPLPFGVRLAARRANPRIPPHSEPHVI